MEGKCLLKTRSDHFKEHWATIVGNDLLCYRRKGDSQPRVMHCLLNTFVSEAPEERNAKDGFIMYPVKIVLPAFKSRYLYFTTHEQQKSWLKQLQTVTGVTNVNDFYEITTQLGKG